FTPAAVRRYRVSSLRSVIAVLLVLGLALSQGKAQGATDGFIIGVITSRAGAAGVVGASQALAAEAWSDVTDRNGGIYGVGVDVRVVDDGGVPARALAAAESLISAGAHALVCCTTAAAARPVSQLAEDAGVLLIS